MQNSKLRGACTAYGRVPGRLARKLTERVMLKGLLACLRAGMTVVSFDNEHFVNGYNRKIPLAAFRYAN